MKNSQDYCFQDDGDNQDPLQLLTQRETESRLIEYQEIVMPSQF